MSIPRDSLRSAPAASLSRRPRAAAQEIFQTFVQQERSIGREEGFQNAILALYARRFGAPSAELVEALHQIHDPVRLEEALGVVAAGTPDEVLATLRR